MVFSLRLNPHENLWRNLPALAGQPSFFSPAIYGRNSQVYMAEHFGGEGELPCVDHVPFNEEKIGPFKRNFPRLFPNPCPSYHAIYLPCQLLC